ncbi:MAG: hypothetical protein WCF84_05710 [Anaerolineae bacterium]
MKKAHPILGELTPSDAMLFSGVIYEVSNRMLANSGNSTRGILPELLKEHAQVCRIIVDDK